MIEKLMKFWNPELLSFRREITANGNAIGLIPQIFNYKVVVGDIDDTTGYLDGF
jgi:hypothetical protein